MSGEAPASSSPKKHRRRTSSATNKSSGSPRRRRRGQPDDDQSAASSSNESAASHSHSHSHSGSSSSSTSSTTSTGSGRRRHRRPSSPLSPGAARRRRSSSGSANSSPTLTRRALAAASSAAGAATTTTTTTVESSASPLSPKSHHRRRHTSTSSSSSRRRKSSIAPAPPPPAAALLNVSSGGGGSSSAWWCGLLRGETEAWRLILARVPLDSLSAASRVSKRMHAIAVSPELWYERCRACFDVFSLARSAYDWRFVFRQLLHVFVTWHSTVVVYGRATLFGADAPLTLQLATLHDAAWHTRMWLQAGRQYRVLMRRAAHGASLELHFLFRWPSAAHVARFCDSQLQLPPSAIVSPHDLRPTKVETDKLAVVDAAAAPPLARFRGVILS